MLLTKLFIFIFFWSTQRCSTNCTVSWQRPVPLRCWWARSLLRVLYSGLLPCTRRRSTWLMLFADVPITRTRTVRDTLQHFLGGRKKSKLVEIIWLWAEELEVDWRDALNLNIKDDAKTTMWQISNYLGVQKKNPFIYYKRAFAIVITQYLNN